MVPLWVSIQKAGLRSIGLSVALAKFFITSSEFGTAGEGGVTVAANRVTAVLALIRISPSAVAASGSRSRSLSARGRRLFRCIALDISSRRECSAIHCV